ncbi:pentatricopeptide repeat-containing protein At2g33680 [Amborella trichopoda]|uniref:Uncharacterized protein n=1 Tax=Amborella trichopoda TaxID=13333 RepID=U5D905_AMBTC|nr:pentatricopeptide repeat-containing protein At2g33680 [Amborella trichopoda]ERN16873.1 hypothetical protein AMTR_s00057p00151990 [Amborella trichopoda]|eukprot:XP_006855406.1 pentatricopeptide repeat-containing protein At2g33680 [Amborella trichopoda]
MIFSVKCKNLITRTELHCLAWSRTLFSLPRSHVKSENLAPNFSNGDSDNLSKSIFNLCSSGQLKEAIETLFSHSQTQTKAPLTHNAYSRLLSESIRSKSLEYGSMVHTHMAQTGFVPDIFIQNNLINMYVKCGSIHGAIKVFDEMPHSDVISWSTMIMGYARCSREKDAFMCFRDMVSKGFMPNQFTYTAALRACALGSMVREGMEVHASIVKSLLLPDTCIESGLIAMYVKFKRKECAYKIFNKMHERDVVSWNTIMAACMGECIEESGLFKSMLRDGFMPNDVTFMNLLGSCSSLSMGMQIHAHAIKHGHGLNSYVRNSLINFYSKVGKLGLARRVFESIKERNEVVWTEMVGKYVSMGHSSEALSLFSLMLRERINPDYILISTILSSCNSPKSLEAGTQIHCFAIKSGFSSVTFVANALMTMYAKCERLSEADLIFCVIDEPDGVSWNAIITGHLHAENHHEVTALFSQMHRVGLWVNHITLTGALCACGNIDDPKLGQHVHTLVMKLGYEQNPFVGNALVTMYALHGCLESAETVFASLTHRDIVSWNSMINGYGENGLSEDSLMLFREMLRDGLAPNHITFIGVLSASASVASLDQGNQIAACITKLGFKPNVPIQNSLINMYAKCGRIDYAVKAFEEIEDPDIVSWNSLITRYAHHGLGEGAVRAFERMQATGVKLDSVTFIGVLSACSHGGLLSEGFHYFEAMSKVHGVEPRLEHYACMVDLLGRLGYLEEAMELIRAMPISPSGLIWRTLLGACRNYGNTKVGTVAAKELLELEPEDAAGYALLSNIYAQEGKWEEMGRVRKAMRERSVRKEVGCSWIEVKGSVHVFQMEDRFHPESEQIYAVLEELLHQKEVGCVE